MYRMMVYHSSIQVFDPFVCFSIYFRVCVLVDNAVIVIFL